MIKSPIGRKLLSFIFALAVITLSIGFNACTQTAKQPETQTLAEVKPEVSITEQEVLNAQKVWGEGIVRIGQVFTEKGDYKSAALNHINELYGYNLGFVLFKPTLVSEKQFRTDKEGALSYFVGDNPNFPEDHGFAIKPWSNVRWESAGVKTNGNMAVAMGNYYFTPANGGPEVKVEYSFAYTKDEEGNLRIILHDSHLPYTPAHH